MGTLTIDSGVEKKIEEYRNKVENNLLAFTEFEKDSGVDPFDPSIPGVAEEFILNRDISNLDFEGRSLVTNLYSKMYSLCKPGKSVVDELSRWVEDNFPEHYLHHISGHFLYPADGGFMGWHTNSDQPGMRIYLTHADATGKSFFRHLDPDTKEVHTSWDEEGWNARYFMTPEVADQHYWHCVYSECNRLSIGMELEHKRNK